jgi:hypothetical protein
MVFAAVVLVSGCLAESARGPGPRYSAASEAPVCQDERPTGSHIPREVCRTSEQLDEEAAARRTWINRDPANPLRGDPTYPGIDLRHAPE